jgi:hypothetical protein
MEIYIYLSIHPFVYPRQYGLGVSTGNLKFSTTKDVGNTHTFAVGIFYGLVQTTGTYQEEING